MELPSASRQVLILGKKIMRLISYKTKENGGNRSANQVYSSNTDVPVLLVVRNEGIQDRFATD